MTLKKATQIALVGTVLTLIVALIEWGMYIFAPELLFYGEHEWPRRIIWLSLILLQTVPLIIFLRVLSEKQKGGENG